MSSVGRVSHQGSSVSCGFGWPRSDTVTTGASWLKEGTLCCVGLEPDLGPGFMCYKVLEFALVAGLFFYSYSDFISLVFSSFNLSLCLLIDQQVGDKPSGSLSGSFLWECWFS